MKKNNQNKTFGSYIRELRIKNDIGQRELAQKIGIAASYLNDIEKNKRTAPRITVLKKISLILKAELDLLNDLASNSKKGLTPDIVDYIEKNPNIVSLIRASKRQIISFAVKPQIIPSFVVNNLYILDRNIRMTTMLGIVGVGGIGYELQSSFRMLNILEFLQL